MTQEIRKQAICSEETFFKSYKVLYEKPGYRETLDCVDCTIYCLLAERYNFFLSLEHHENQVKTRSGDLGIRYSENKIAEYLQVSRNKVSLAIRKLEILGLITVEREPKKASVYIVKDIPTDVPQERIAKVKELLKERKQRNKKYNNKDLLHMEQDPKLASYRATPPNMLQIEQDPKLASYETRTCSKQSKNMLQIEQDLALNEYSNKTKKKEPNKNPERGSASLLESACPPAVINQDNDGIPGDVDAISGVGLSLPPDQDNDGLSDMMSPSENTIVVTPPRNTGQQTKDDIKQKEQSTSGSPTQHGIAHKATPAASTQKLTKEKTLGDWLADNCKIRWIIDAVLTKLDGDQIMPRSHTPEWDAIMRQVAAALPPLTEVLLRLGQNQEDIDSATRYISRQPDPRPSKVITFLCCQYVGPLRIYYAVDDFLAA